LIRTFLIALAVIVAAPLTAQDAMPPRFFIEKIEVRDAERVSPDVVIAESRLHDGHEYTEADLRDASARLTRLPYLLSAEFSLEKGSERGRYVLVVTINETKAFFYALDFRPILKSDDHVEPDYSDRLTVGDNAATLGMRWFMGRRGALHIALVTTNYNDELARDYAAFAVGYTQYDLFGTRAFATLSIKQVFTDGEAVPSPQLVVGIPVTANQTLTLDIDETRLADETREILGQSFDTQRGQRVVGLTWSYNTTNRPFIPTRGTLLTVRPRFAWSDTATYRIIYVPEPPSGGGGVFGAERDTVHAEAREVAFNAARYWELTDRSSVSGGVESSWTHFRLDSSLQGLHSEHIARAILAAGYSYSLWDAERTKSGDSRLELNVRVGNRSIALYDFYRTDQRQVSASWVRRSSWGVLRLGAGYAW
jgi:hypothetical protein